MTNVHVQFNNFLQDYHGYTLSEVMQLRIAVADNNDVALELWDNLWDQFYRLYGRERLQV